MTEKRYYQRDFEELYYIIDSNVISEKEFDEKMEYEGYTAFEDSLTGEEIVDLLNENEELKQSYAKLKHRHSLLHDVCIEAECERDSYRKDVLSLGKENEQLKSENKRLKKDLEHCANQFTDDGKNLLLSLR